MNLLIHEIVRLTKCSRKRLLVNHITARTQKNRVFGALVDFGERKVSLAQMAATGNPGSEKGYLTGCEFFRLPRLKAWTCFRASDKETDRREA